jgi:hypothetical protein
LDSSPFSEVGNLGPIFVRIGRCTEGRAAGMCGSISSVPGHIGGVGVTRTPLHVAGLESSCWEQEYPTKYSVILRMMVECEEDQDWGGWASQRLNSCVSGN